MDNRHITIQLGCEEDFLRIYSKSSWVVDGKLMRIFKWHTEFHVEKESTLYPAWISLPRLPLHFFNREALFTMMYLVGNPLRIDGATATLKRPSLAKVQVEVDLLKEIPEKIWIGTGQSGGFWQKLEVDYLPPYSVHCWHVGHSEEQCTVKFPELKPVGKDPIEESRPKQFKMVYRPKNKVTPIIAEKDLQLAINPQTCNADPDQGTSLVSKEPAPSNDEDVRNSLIHDSEVAQPSRFEALSLIQEEEETEVSNPALNLIIYLSQYPVRRCTLGAEPDNNSETLNEN